MSDATTKAYKIRDLETGLYSKAGDSNYSGWSKKGKVWASEAALKSHIRLCRTKYEGKQCEIVLLETVVSEQSSPLVLSELIAQMDERDRKEEAERKAAAQRRAEQFERAELNRLRKKYG